MPSFTPEDIDIDPEKFIESCSSKEIKEIIEVLVENNHISHQVDITSVGNISAGEILFENYLSKLHGKWNQITSEEEDFIIDIARRF